MASKRKSELVTTPSPAKAPRKTKNLNVILEVKEEPQEDGVGSSKTILTQPRTTSSPRIRIKKDIIREELADDTESPTNKLQASGSTPLMQIKQDIKIEKYNENSKSLSKKARESGSSIYTAISSCKNKNEIKKEPVKNKVNTNNNPAQKKANTKKTSDANKASTSTENATQTRDPVIEKMERSLGFWLTLEFRNDKCVTAAALQEKAKNLWEITKREMGAENIAVAAKLFTASSAWLESFKHRQGLIQLPDSEIKDITQHENDMILKETVEIARKCGMDVTEKDFKDIEKAEDRWMRHQENMQAREIRALEEEAENPDKKLTLAILNKALAKLDEGVKLLQDNDPQVTRSSLAAQNVKTAKNRYVKLLNELKMKRAQPTINHFFKPKET